jgi:CYTH domain-containing protein
VSTSLKYAVIERERRFLLAALPKEAASDVMEIVDRYVIGTRMRLREIRTSNGQVVRKLSHKVRLTEGPAAIACTNLYLNAAEWELLKELPARILRKTRHVIQRDGVTVAIDELDGGTLIAEIDDDDAPPQATPDWLLVIEDVSGDERWTGAGLAR